VCGCPVDAVPHDPQGREECLGCAAFHVAEGHLDEVALYNQFPSHLTAGNWKIGFVIDDEASEAQADALERIVSGNEGGAFGELSQFFGENLGTERARISLTDGETPRLSIDGKTQLEFEPLRGPDGGPTKVKNAMFGFSPEFTIGTTTGSSQAFGLTFEPTYGETSEYAFSSEQPEGAATGR
jgi:hypothetical protein